MRTATSRCYFERSPQRVCPEGRILLVSYHFPPGRAAGVLRWQKFARHAAELGWGIDAIALDPDSLDARDDARLEDLPEGTRAFGIPSDPLAVQRVEHAIWRLYRRVRPARGATGGPAGGAAGGPRAAATPAAATPSSFGREDVAFEPASLRSWIRTYEAAVEYGRFGAWARRAADLGCSLFDPDSHRLVVSCGPPHMAHLAAASIARATGLPMIADFRDPWTQGERLPESIASPIWYWLASRYEHRAVEAASLVVMNTEPARRALQAIHPAHADRIIAVPNGCDEQPLPSVARDRRFLVAYAGTVYLDRTPATLFRAVARLVRDRGLTPDDLAIEFMGFIASLDGRSIEDLAEAEGIAAFVRTHPPQSYEAAERFLASADLLVSLPQDSDLAIPSKIYEYMRYEARLLVLAERESATEELLRESGADVVAPGDEEGVLKTLLDAFEQRARGERPRPIAADASLSRRTRTRELFEAIVAHGLASPRATS